MHTGGRVRTERRLAAILAADVAGCSRLIGADEEGTLDRLSPIRAEIIEGPLTCSMVAVDIPVVDTPAADIAVVADIAAAVVS